MLNKKERLNREQFNRFFASKTGSSSPALRLIYTEHETLHGAVVVPKKVLKGATKRNKLRRRIYDAFRKYARDKKTNGVYIFIVKEGAVLLNYTELAREIEQLCSEARKMR